MTTSDKLQSIKPGDRVRVTVHADVVMVNKGCVDLVLDGDEPITIGGWAHEADTFQIERIEPPLKVGDRVRPRGSFGEVWKIVAMEDGYAVLYAGLDARVACPTELERIA